MKQNLNLATLQIRLLFITALLAMACFAMVSQYSDTPSYTDDTTRVLVLQLQEFNGDSEFPLDNQTIADALSSSLLLVLASVFIVQYFRSKNIIHSLRFLSLIRPRSPPVL